MDNAKINLNPDEIVVIACLDEFRKDNPRFVRHKLFLYIKSRGVKRLSKDTFYDIMEKLEDDGLIVNIGEQARKNVFIYEVGPGLDNQIKYINAKALLKNLELSKRADILSGETKDLQKSGPSKERLEGLEKHLSNRLDVLEKKLDKITYMVSKSIVSEQFSDYLEYFDIIYETLLEAEKEGKTMASIASPRLGMVGNDPVVRQIAENIVPFTRTTVQTVIENLREGENNLLAEVKEVTNKNRKKYQIDKKQGEKLTSYIIASIKAEIMNKNTES